MLDIRAAADDGMFVEDEIGNAVVRAGRYGRGAACFIICCTV